MEAFVDDTDVAVNDSEQPYTSQQLVEILQIDAQHWEKLLITSGGKLELSKCFFYIMHWKFTPEGTPSLTGKDELPHKLLLQQGNNRVPTEILQKDCDESHKTLGVMKAPNRSQAGEIARLHLKCNTHAKTILSNGVTQSDAPIAYRVYHLTSVGYSLGTTYIQKQQFETMQGRVVSAFLATSGYNRHFPRAIVFAPRAYGGLDFTHLYLLQGQQCVRLLYSGIRYTRLKPANKFK
jgi:hypothetical protein